MPINLNLADAEDQTDVTWRALPEGKYRATIRDAQMRESKGGPNAKLPAGTPGLNVRFEIAKEDVPSSDGLASGERYSNQAFKWYAIVSDTSVPSYQTMTNILYGFLKACGYEEKVLKSKKFELQIEDLPGTQVVLSLQPNEFQGREQNNVRYVAAQDASTEPGLV